jgi:hypothetical protein
VVHEYVSGTGACGGPLVTSFNVTSRSDLRLYQSDNSATIITLKKQGANFLNTCVGLLQRMIETIPNGVALSDVVAPMKVKPINATLDFDIQGNLIFSGYIRVSLSPFLSSPTHSKQRQILRPTMSGKPLDPEFLTTGTLPPIPLTPEPA